MNRFKWVMVILSLLVIALGVVIVAPYLGEEPLLMADAGAETGEGEKGQEQELRPPPLALTVPKSTVEFDLKYDRYLIPAPYHYEVDGIDRYFQFEKMVEALKKPEEEFAKGGLTYIDNYKNQNGRAPYYRGKSVDAFGNQRSASAPAYPDKGDLTEFIYIADGNLVRVEEEKSDFTKVILVDSGKAYYVPSKYVRTEHYMKGLKKAIIVDRENQNIATFERRTYGGNMGSEKKTRWTVVSYSLATTGKVGKYHQPTPLGYYYAIEKKERFYYLKDGTNIIEGYAPYAVRFTAGAYTHGIATAYIYGADGTRKDPGIHEFSDSIGTIPLSHKCVRNYTSHAKFIYDWYEEGETIVIVIE